MKETFYFRHDYNAHDDNRLKKVIRRHGAEGFGVYWYLVELLFQESGAWFLPKDYEDFAHDLRTDESTVKSVVEAFGLFEYDAKNFWNKRVDEEIEFRAEKSKSAKKAAKIRWSKGAKAKEQMRTHMQPHSEHICSRNTRKEKERKGKERKEKKTVGKKISPEDQKFSEVFFESAGAEFLFTQKKTEKDIPQILETWADEFRKLREVDGLTEKQIEYLLNWLFHDSSDDANFWRKQIRTPGKLRKKSKDGSQYWRILVLKIKEAAPKKAVTPKFETL